MRCIKHGKTCTMVCTFKSCLHRTICSECIITHPKNHLSKVQPISDFDSDSSHIPTMIGRDLHQLKQRMTMLQNHLVGNREGRKSEVKRLIQSIHDVIQDDIDAFHKQILQGIEIFYTKPHDLVTEIIKTCDIHLEQLGYLIGEGAPHSDQLKFDQLLDYQEKLLTIIIPKMAEQADITGTKSMAEELQVTVDHFNKVLRNYFRKGLNVFTVLNVVQINDKPQLTRVTDSLETFKLQQFFQQQGNRKVQEEHNNKRNMSYYKDTLQPYLKKDLEYKVPQSSDFNVKATQSLGFYKQNAVPYEIFQSYQKHLNTVLVGHEDIITCMCIVSLKQIASGGGDGLIKIWDIDSQACVGNMQGHIGEVWDIVPILDEEGLVTHLGSAGKDKTIKIWSCARMTCELTMSGHLDIIKCLATIPDLGQIVSAGADYKLRFWNYKTGKQVLSIDDAHPKLIRSICYVQKKGWILSGGTDGIMKVWGVNKGQLINSLNHGAEIMVIKHLQDDYLLEQISLIATGGSDRQIIIWNLDAGIPMRSLYGHHDSVTCLDYSLSLQTLISGGKDKTIRIWNPFDSKLIKSIKAHNDVISVIKIHEARKLAITASWDKFIRVVSIEYLMQKEKKNVI